MTITQVLDQWFPTWGPRTEFTAGAREKIYVEVGLGDETITIIIQGSRLILPTGHTCVTNFLSWSHEHIIWSQIIIIIFFDTTFD